MRLWYPEIGSHCWKITLECKLLFEVSHISPLAEDYAALRNSERITDVLAENWRPLCPYFSHTFHVFCSQRNRWIWFQDKQFCSHKFEKKNEKCCWQMLFCCVWGYFLGPDVCSDNCTYINHCVTSHTCNSCMEIDLWSHTSMCLSTPSTHTSCSSSSSSFNPQPWSQLADIRGY